MLNELLKGARVFDLGRPLERGMPQSPNHPPFQMILERRRGGRYRPGDTSAANEIIITGGHVGTHVDALSHFSCGGKLHGGVDAFEAQAGGRFKDHGVEKLPPVFGRGILIDLPTHLGEACCAPGYEITIGDLERAAAGAGVTIGAGDTVLVRTGWGRLWDDRDAFLGLDAGLPGPGADAIAWLCERGVRVVGSDTIAFEHIAAGKGLSELPGHKILLVDHGVPIIETLDLETLAEAGPGEFLFVMAPLKLVGATASPVRPLAVTLSG
ncbi:MAG: cyclase family protein [Kiloniellaceae bacterium]